MQYDGYKVDITRLMGKAEITDERNRHELKPAHLVHTRSWVVASSVEQALTILPAMITRAPPEFTVTPASGGWS